MKSPALTISIIQNHFTNPTVAIQAHESTSHHQGTHVAIKENNGISSLDVRENGVLHKVVLFGKEDLAEQLDVALEFNPSTVTFLLEGDWNRLNRVPELLENGYNVNVSFTAHQPHEAMRIVKNELSTRESQQILITKRLSDSVLMVNMNGLISNVRIPV